MYNKHTLRHREFCSLFLVFKWNGSIQTLFPWIEQIELAKGFNLRHISALWSLSFEKYYVITIKYDKNRKFTIGTLSQDLQPQTNVSFIFEDFLRSLGSALLSLPMDSEKLELKFSDRENVLSENSIGHVTSIFQILNSFLMANLMIYPNSKIQNLYNLFE